MTTQAPHAIRTVFALVAGHVGLSEEKIRIISPDIGGGFGGKVPVYPGYVIAVAASVVTGKPVKWIEDRMENLQADSFARDYHMDAELAAKKDGKITALRIKTVADHGYADAAANPSKFPAGLFSVCTGSYDIKHAFVEVDGVYTNKPPGGIAYRCSFRVTEAAHAIERMADMLAQELKMDPAELRLKNFIPPEKFPYKSALGWEYDSGNYAGALKKAMEQIGYAELRKEQAEKRAARRADGHRHLQLHRDRRRRAVQALRHPRASRCSTRASCACTPPARPSRASARSRRARATRRPTRRSSPRSWASPPPTSQVEEGDTDTAPYGLGTYASRSTPTAGAAGAIAARKVRDKARKIAAHLLEVSEDDLEWEPGKFSVKGAPAEDARRSRRSRFAAYTNHPPGHGGGARGRQLLRPAEPHLPVRQLHLRGGHRPRHGRGEDPALRGHRRLRQHHQPDDRRRARSTAA